MIAVCIGGKYVIFVGAASFLACIHGWIPISLGTTLEFSVLHINFQKVSNRRSRVFSSLFSVFVLLMVLNRLRLTLGSQN